VGAIRFLIKEQQNKKKKR